MFGRRTAARWLSALTLVALATTAAATTSPERVGPQGFLLWGDPRDVAEISFEDSTGATLTLADLEGKVVLLNIWATWCVPCREEMPTLDALQAELGGTDFEVVALSIDRKGLEMVIDFYREVGIEHLAQYIDRTGNASAELGAVGIPTTLLLDRQGREMGRLVGEAEWDSPDMVEFLTETIATAKEETP